MKPLRKFLIGAWYATVFSLAAALAAEFFLRAFWPMPVLKRLRSAALHEVTGPGLFRPLPSASVRETLRAPGRLLYDVSYETDGARRRITPPPRTKASEFVALWGGSFVFGAGLPADESLPWQLALREPRKRVYNYGMIGAGPQSFLRWLELGGLAEIPESRGTHVFVLVTKDNFSDSSYGDVQKLVGSFEIDADTWQRHLPRYRAAGERLEYAGTLHEGSSLRADLVARLQRLELSRRLKLSFPWIGPKHYDALARVFLEAERVLAAKGQRFAVAIHPLSDDKSAAQAEAALRTAQIAIIPVGKWGPEQSAPARGADGVHPSAAANAFLASELAKFHF